MLVEGIIGNLRDEAGEISEVYKGKQIDYVEVEWHETHKKIQRKVTQGGVEVGMRFEDSILVHGLKQDDVLYEDDQMIVVVNIQPCDALVIEVEDHHLLPKVCYEVGNKHMPFFRGKEHHVFITPYDKPLEVLISKLGVKTERKQVAFDFNHSISSSIGGHHH